MSVLCGGGCDERRDRPSAGRSGSCRRTARLGSRRPARARSPPGLLLITCAAGAAIAFIVFRPHPSAPDPNQVPDDRLQVRQFIRDEPPPLPPASAPAAMPAPPPVAAPVLPDRTSANPLAPLLQQREQRDPMEKARHAPLLAFSAGTAAAAPTSSPVSKARSLLAALRHRSWPPNCAQPRSVASVARSFRTSLTCSRRATSSRACCRQPWTAPCRAS